MVPVPVPAFRRRLGDRQLGCGRWLLHWLWFVMPMFVLRSRLFRHSVARLLAERAAIEKVCETGHFTSDGSGGESTRRHACIGNQTPILRIVYVEQCELALPEAFSLC
jgi:hypothetical protein